jgi:hypothetical protein
MSAAVTVIGLGCELDRLFEGQRPALPVPAPPDRDDLRDLFDTIAAPARAGESVIVVVGDWLPAETLSRVRTVHSLLETDRVAIHVTSLPPLAASVLAALAAALTPWAPSAGALAGALESVAGELVVLAWAGTVAGLRHSEVSLLHHARSALPWSSFAIGVQPESFVVPLGRRGAELPLSPPAHPVDLLVAPADHGELDWIVQEVAPALGGATVRELHPTLHGSQWWGTSRLVEAVGVPTSLEWLAQATLPREVAPCAWCREPIAVSPCPFCGDAGLRSTRLSTPVSAGTLGREVGREN